MPSYSRIHQTPVGEVISRAYQIRDGIYRSEVQLLKREAAAAIPSRAYGSLDKAWAAAEEAVLKNYPHDCAKTCPPRQESAG